MTVFANKIIFTSFSYDAVKDISMKHFYYGERLMTTFNFTHLILFHQISLQILQTICEYPVDLLGYILPEFRGAMNFSLPLKYRTNKYCSSEFDILLEVFNKKKCINYLHSLNECITTMLWHFHPNLTNRAICQHRKYVLVNILSMCYLFSVVSSQTVGSLRNTGREGKGDTRK